MNVALWISSRLRLSTTSRGRFAPSAAIAVGGVALAVMIMELTIAVVTGFKHRISEKIMGFDSQITVGAPYDSSYGAQVDYVTLTPGLRQTLDSFDAPALPSLSMQLPGMIKTDDNFAGVIYVARDSLHDFSFERDNVVEGTFPDFSSPESRSQIVISDINASALGLSAGDRVYSCYFVGDALRTRRHTVAAVYRSNLDEYDRTVVYASLPELQSVARVDSLTGTRVEFSGFPVDSIADAAGRLQNCLNNAAYTGTIARFYPVVSVLQTGAVYFNWLALLDTNVIVLLVLMLCVAGFTLTSSVYMIILDRLRLIGVLRALGASRPLVSRIFVGLGMRLAIVGLLVGDILALTLAWIQSSTRFLSLDPEMYYIDYVPVEIDIPAMLLLNLGVVVAVWLVLFIPSRSAARTDPASIVRND